MNHQPLRITATLAGGIAHAAPWGLALDGLLASQLWTEHKITCRHRGEPEPRAKQNPTPPDLDLPLARCTRAGNDWHWAATCAYPTIAAATEIHTITGYADHRHLEHATRTLPKTISARQGRYRARRMPILTTNTPAVTWHAVGDLDAITDLLADIGSIGKKRAIGEGHVLAWNVEPAPDLTIDQAAHLHPDGTLGRPTPPACAHHLGLGDTTVGSYGLRPPYMHPARLRPLHLPQR